MGNRYAQFATSLVQDLLRDGDGWLAFPGSAVKLQVRKEDGSFASLDLTPFSATPVEATAAPFFAGVTSVTELISAYHAAKRSARFEVQMTAGLDHVSDYAEEFLVQVLARAERSLTRGQAVLIANWVKDLDVYCAVKSVESLLYSKADLALLEVAAPLGWTVHFDHLAIRCGSRAHLSAEKVAQLLTKQHDYVASQVPEEAFYQFPDGWNAYPVYKMLRNGQVLRVFIDQSDAEDKKQIIQYWNTVYGYTAHHLAMRATKLQAGMRVAVPLLEVMDALHRHGVHIMSPTGLYTHGLLEQVFTKPERNTQVPVRLKNELAAIDQTLPQTIENAKLLELVSRKEMKSHLAQQFFALYGLVYDPVDAHHSAPLYQYFLPEQAAHVIRTSQQVS